jgi:hypothetical protein
VDFGRKNTADDRDDDRDVAGVLPPKRRAARRTRRAAAAIIGMALVGGGSFAVSNWVVGLNGGSSGEGRSATIQNLSISAVAAPAPGNLLYPGGNGDVVVTISNPNPYPVTITAVQLPTNTTFAGGFSDSALGTPQAGCTNATSGVFWNFATGASGSSHTLTTPLTVGANGAANNPLVVTLTNDASMTNGSDATCANTFFSMPSLIGVSASGGAAASTPSPATDGWTS